MRRPSSSITTPQKNQGRRRRLRPGDALIIRRSARTTQATAGSIPSPRLVRSTVNRRCRAHDALSIGIACDAASGNQCSVEASNDIQGACDSAAMRALAQQITWAAALVPIDLFRPAIRARKLFRRRAVLASLHHPMEAGARHRAEARRTTRHPGPRPDRKRGPVARGYQAFDDLQVRLKYVGHYISCKGRLRFGRYWGGGTRASLRSYMPRDTRIRSLTTRVLCRGARYTISTRHIFYCQAIS